MTAAPLPGLSIGVLVTGEPPAELGACYPGYGTMIETLLRQQDPTVNCAQYAIRESQFPADIEDHDAYVITGSRHAAYEELEWIHQLSNCIRDLDARRKPLVGICFGHQLIAQALGGRVTKAPQGWGVGVHAAKISAPAPWMHDSGGEFALVVSHQDQVIELPERAERLAGSEFCPIAMYRIGQHVFALQAHPEFSREYSRDLMTVRRNLIGEERIVAGMRSLADEVDSARVANWMLAFMRQASA